MGSRKHRVVSWGLGRMEAIGGARETQTTRFALLTARPAMLPSIKEEGKSPKSLGTTRA